MSSIKNDTKSSHTSQVLEPMKENFFSKGSQSAFSGTKDSYFFSKTASTVQTKLTVGAPDDPYEKEADTMADKVVHRKSNYDSSSLSSNGNKYRSFTPRIQRMCTSCALEKKLQPKSGSEHGINGRKDELIQPCSECKGVNLQRMAAGSPDESDPLEQNLNSSKGKGSPLPDNTRKNMESSFGADFSKVRIHDDSTAAGMNKQLSAHAFTHGSDIYFNSGKYNPNHDEGQKLLAHELTHTIQQGGSKTTDSSSTQSQNHPLLQTKNEKIQRHWYNVSIPFTDYEFDPSIEGVKTAAGLVKDKLVDAAEWIIKKIKGIIDSGKKWIQEKWDDLKKFAKEKWDELKDAFGSIIHFITSPFSAFSDAIMNYDGDAIELAWQVFKGTTDALFKTFKELTDGLLDTINYLWKLISRFADDVFDAITDVTNSWAFDQLPGFIKDNVRDLVKEIKSWWKAIRDGFTSLLNSVRSWIDKAIDSVQRFILKVASFGINVIVKGIKVVGKVILLMQDMFLNPSKYAALLAKKTADALSNVEDYFKMVFQKYFGTGKQSQTPDSTKAIQKKPDDTVTSSAPRKATWSEIGSGIWEMMGKKWNEFKSNPLSIVTGLLMDLFLPIVGNIKDVIQLGKNIYKIVTGPLHASSLEEFWTSLLLLLDIPIMIYNTIVSIVMRTLTLPLIIASFIPEPFIQAIATTVGYVLLGAFVQGEVLNLGHKLLLLKTGATTDDQKKDAYNSIADSVIALAMTAAIIIIMLILHFLVSIIKGVFNFVKGKLFNVEVKPGEAKVEGKTGEGKTEEPPKDKDAKAGTAEIKEKGPSKDNQRTVELDSENKCEVCASPCEEIKQKYNKEINENPDKNYNKRIDEIRDNTGLTDEQKLSEYKKIEQELADMKSESKSIEASQAEANNLDPKSPEAETTTVSEAKAKPKPGEPGSPEHKKLRWEEYEKRTTPEKRWKKSHWENVYDANMERAKKANIAVDKYKATLDWGPKAEREVRVEIEGVERRFDILETDNIPADLRKEGIIHLEDLEKNGIKPKAVEHKTGKIYNSQDIQWEVARDEILVKEKGWKITWIFEGTASGPLQEALTKAGISFQIIPPP